MVGVFLGTRDDQHRLDKLGRDGTIWYAYLGQLTRGWNLSIDQVRL